jgi:aspartyl-tRNA(Asn)/glutamyl-tRNA(Gln) amidotransferase subunit A
MATPTDLRSLTLVELAAAIRERRVSSVEATRACLDALATTGVKLNAVAGCDPERALADAARADRELARGEPRGLLHGVPLAHKDMFHRRGRVSAYGSRIAADNLRSDTATVLARLDRAGALDIARLNMVEFAAGPTGHNEITGTPRNPWNPEYITGGSSSGPAAALAARLVPATLGSDTGGSIRIPAACCALVGMKPTYGRVSRAGALPLTFTLDHVGPITRIVADCALMLGLIAGHDPLDPTSSERAVDDYSRDLEDGVRGLRIALAERYFLDQASPEIAQGIQEVARVFERLGARVIPVEVPGIEIANPMTSLIIAVEAAAFHAKWLSERPQDYGRQTLGRLAAGLAYPAVRYVEALNLRQRVLAALKAAVFDSADLLLAPVLLAPVPTIAESDLAANPGFSEFVVRFGYCSRPFNYVGLPAISVPCGFTANGLPAAMQLAGRPFAERLLLRAARAYERETRCTEPAPRLASAEH